ncbi:MAG: hypothetical protein LIO96_11770 [Lachnospiraceae bacterium]|nr:hypothetical protein [Lachnospiraceae bacterium]
MAKPATRHETIQLPDDIGNRTVNDLLNSPNTTVIKRGNKISIRNESDQGVATLEYSTYSLGHRSLKASTAPRKEYKRDYREDIIEMKRSGMRQKDIAFELGISEAYISTLLKQ